MYSTGTANIQDPQSCNADEEEINWRICQDDYIPLPNPFKKCKNGTWTGGCYGPVENIASGPTKRFVDIIGSTNQQVPQLTDGNNGTFVEIPPSERREWRMDLRINSHAVYSVVIEHNIELVEEASIIYIIHIF